MRGAGAEVGEREITLQPSDRLLEQHVVLAKDRAMAGQQPFDVAGPNPFELFDEGRNVAAMVGVDRADRTVTVDVVTG